MIDSHCHLDHEPLFSNINEIINRSKKIGLKKILTISTSIKSFENIRKIIEIDDMIYGTIGIHPHDSSKDKVNSNYLIENAKKHKKIIGVGETGLDFYYENSKKSDQIDSFIDHIEASIALNYPVIVHSRSAENETFEILNKYKNTKIKILMHCFTGSKEFAKKLIDLNCYISLSGIITFKNSTLLCDVVKTIPIENLLVETDSPYLAPDPYRGKTNEPSYIIHTIDKLSNIKKVSKESIIYYTTNNFKKLFNLS